eukprot:2860898-Prymnesium_polylepis.1
MVAMCMPHTTFPQPQVRRPGWRGVGGARSAWCGGATRRARPRRRCWRLRTNDLVTTRQDCCDSAAPLLSAHELHGSRTSLTATQTNFPPCRTLVWSGRAGAR